jgi:hypothetical protein
MLACVLSCSVYIDLSSTVRVTLRRLASAFPSSESSRLLRKFPVRNYVGALGVEGRELSARICERRRDGVFIVAIRNE